MTWDPTPWAIGGGASHSPAVLRTLAHAATSGAEGIVTPVDLKVTALSTPAGSVQVSPGAALILNRSASGASQTYAARNPTVDTVPVAATGAGGRSDLVVVRIEDPQYSPWPAPADPLVAQYVRTFVVQGVASGVTRASQLNLGYSAIAIARIDIPANTSAITNAMIVDVRQVALPRQMREIQVSLPGAERTAGSTAWTQLNLGQNIEVPPWATHALVVVTVSGLEHLTGNFLGDIRANAFRTASQDVVLDLNWTGNPTRNTFMAAGTFVIPSDLRGTVTAIALDGRRRGGTGSIQTDAGSTVTTDVTFQERAF